MGLFTKLWHALTGGHAGQHRHINPSPNVPAFNRESDVAVLDLPNFESAPNPARGDDAPWWALPAAELVEFPALVRPDLTPDARALENLLVSYFDGHNLTLPPMVGAAEKVLTRLRDSKAGLADVAKDVAQDQVLAAAILRMANSALYRGLNPITTLPTAVNRLGAQTLRMLVVRESMRAATFSREQDPLGFSEAIWQRSLASAYVMQALSDFTSVPADDAFMYGLLHDIGNVVVLREVLSRPKNARADIDETTFQYLCDECHQEFGELVAEAWKLPPELAALAGDHHRFPEEGDALRAERLQLQVSDMCLALMGYAPFQPFDLRNARAVTCLGLFGKTGFEVFLNRLPDYVADLLGES